jgi:hypothetical protein
VTTYTDPDERAITVRDVISDQGTIVVFEGEDEDGNVVRFAADHRQGALIAAAFVADNDCEPVVASVPSWAILGGAA